MHTLTQTYFWFSQPSTYLTNYDNYFVWIFVAMFGLGILFKLAARFTQHSVNRKLLNKFANLGFYMGFFGIVWFGLRYENTPFFADRYWAGFVIAISLIWLGYIVKYIVWNYMADKREYDKQQLNSRYIPGAKR